MPFDLMGYAVHDLTLEEAVRDVMTLIGRPAPSHVTFLNAHYVNVGATHERYSAALRSADRVYADGSGLRIAGRLSGHRLRDNVNGTDLFPLLCRPLRASGLSVFLLGGRPGVADGVRRWLEGRYPGLDVCGARHGYLSPEGRRTLTDDIRAASPDLLLVALGAPYQDVWIRENINRMGVPVTMAVGGLFDFYSGSIPRAPHWMRDLGVEWIFRLLQEPTRLWRRYLLGNLAFLGRATMYAMRTRLEAARP